MMDVIFRVGLSNSCLAVVLAAAAMLVGANAKRASLAHVLWLMVLLKLVTPPIVNVSAPYSWQSETSLLDDEQPQFEEDSSFLSDTNPGLPLVAPTTGPEPIEASSSPPSEVRPSGVAVFEQAKPTLAAIWMAGSLAVFLWSVVRIYRFNVLLTMNRQAAPREVQDAARRITDRLSSNATPEICTTSARIAPMVWWVGGRVRVVVPEQLLRELRPDQWEWVLAHELAHVQRRDYLVRWLEWFACVCFWWNPVVWWAQRNLRATEEICCDGLVLSSLNAGSHSYAESILTAVESLVAPVLRPPAVASEINSGGFLERRIEMILSGESRQRYSRGLQFGVLALAMFLIPIGIVHAQDFDAVSKRLAKSVKKGEITHEQAAAMLRVLRADDAQPRQPQAGRTDRKPVQVAWEASLKAMEDAMRAQELKTLRAREAAQSNVQRLFEELQDQLSNEPGSLRAPLSRALIKRFEQQREQVEKARKALEDAQKAQKDQKDQKDQGSATWFRRYREDIDLKDQSSNEKTTREYPLVPKVEYRKLTREYPLPKAQTTVREYALPKTIRLKELTPRQEQEIELRVELNDETVREFQKRKDVERKVELEKAKREEGKKREELEKQSRSETEYRDAVLRFMAMMEADRTKRASSFAQAGKELVELQKQLANKAKTAKEAEQADSTMKKLGDRYYKLLRSRNTERDEALMQLDILKKRLLEQQSKAQAEAVRQEAEALNAALQAKDRQAAEDAKTTAEAKN